MHPINGRANREQEHEEYSRAVGMCDSGVIIHVDAPSLGHIKSPGVVQSVVEAAHRATGNS